MLNHVSIPFQVKEYCPLVERTISREMQTVDRSKSMRMSKKSKKPAAAHEDRLLAAKFKSLEAAVHSKKKKNVEILHLAAEVSRASTFKCIIAVKGEIRNAPCRKGGTQLKTISGGSIFRENFATRKAKL